MVAADIAAAGVVCLGIYLTVLTGWIALAFYHQTGNPFFRGSGLVGMNPVSSVLIVGSGAGVVLDVMLSALVLGFGVWAGAAHDRGAQAWCSATPHWPTG